MKEARSRRDLEARRCTETMRGLLLGYKARMEEELRDTGVTLAQLRMLRAIEQQSEASAAAIARDCHITPQTLQSMLARATREGWIIRGSSDRNHRFVTAALTPSGRAVLRDGMNMAARVEQQIWRGVPLDAMRSMRTTLQSGLANLEER